MARKSRAQLKTEAADQELEGYRRKVEAAMDLIDDAKRASQTDDDYYNDKQWTADELRILRKRKQPVITDNYIKPAINAIIGIVERGRTDPKAWGRSPKDQDAAEVATDALRYVADVNRFQTSRRQALKDLLIWGICGGIVEVDGDKEIKFSTFRPEEYFYDPYSREADFSDARYDGLAKWMDEADVIALYPDKEADIRASVDMGNNAVESFKDRPNRAWSWADQRSRRTMVFELYHRRGADWFKCVFVAGCILENGPSPYKDSKGRPKKCTIAQSAYVDRENCRYGIVRSMVGPQDAINKITSKATHILNTRQVRVDPGVKDVDDVRREAAKADGVFEYRKDQMEILSTHTQFMPSYMELLRDAKQNMARQSPSPGIVGRQGASQSGRAILAEQQAGMTEQAPILAAFDDWTLRIYRSMWEAVRQFWDAPKFIRVTDDENAPKFIQLNQPVVDPVTGQPMIDPQTGQPAVQNAPATMDIDIIIDSTPDTAAIQEEQFAKLVELTQAGIPFPPDVIIEASSLPKKRLLLDKLKQAQEQAQGQPNPLQIEQEKAQLQLQSKQQMAEMDAQAHMAQLARDDEADQRKAQRAAALEEQRANYKAQEMERQAMLQAQSQASQLEHTSRMKELELGASERQSKMQFEFKTKEAQANANAKAKPQVGISLGEETEAAIAASQQQSADAMAQAAQGIQAAAQAMVQVAKVVASPRELIVDPKTGRKRVQIVRDTVN